MRYVLHPGYVSSIHDGQFHYITADQLIKLYQLPPNSRVWIITHADPKPGYREEPGDVHLHPRRDGDYTLPT